MRLIGSKRVAIVISLIIIGSASSVFRARGATQSFEASFNCTQAKSEVERKICEDRDLAEADVEMARLYKSLLSRLPDSDKKELKREQRDWLKLRDSCGSSKVIVDCLKDSYATRTGALKGKEWPVISQAAHDRAAVSGKTDDSKAIQKIYIDGRYEKTNKYDGGEIVIKRVSSDRINIKIYATVTNSSCQLGNTYGEEALEAYATVSGNAAIYSDQIGCKLTLHFQNNRVVITTTEECNDYCGVHARGGMDGSYAKRSDATTQPKYEVLDFTFMDTGGAAFHSTRLLKQLKVKYGYRYPSVTVILVETSSFDNPMYKQQRSIINSLVHSGSEEMRWLNVVACSSAEYKQGYHTSIETAKILSDGRDLFRIRLLTEDGHIINVSDYPLTAEELKIILKNTTETPLGQ